MATIIWPRGLFPPRALRFDPDFRNRSGGAPLDGPEQIIGSGRSLWSASLNASALSAGPEQVRVWRALAAKMRGRANPALLPAYDAPRAPWPTIAGTVVSSWGAVPWASASPVATVPWAGGTYWQARVIDVAVAAPAVEGATQITLAIALAGTVEPGHQFSIGERLYRIADGYALQGATLATFTITPPLRDAVAAGDRAEFDRPVCRMRLVRDDGMNLELDLNQFAAPTVAFVEDY